MAHKQSRWWIFILFGCSNRGADVAPRQDEPQDGGRDASSYWKGAPVDASSVDGLADVWGPLPEALPHEDCGNGEGGRPCCPEPFSRTRPTDIRTTVDLSKIDYTADGTCHQRLARGNTTFQLPSDVGAYPLKIVLPALSGGDPDCAAYCSGSPATAFGIAVEVGGLLSDREDKRTMAVSVPEPWKFVSGGCGEACPWSCLSGYQEYGGPQSCISIDYGGFGFATADPHAKSVEVTVEVYDVAQAEIEPRALNCCPYRVQ